MTVPSFPTRPRSKTMIGLAIAASLSAVTTASAGVVGYGGPTTISNSHTNTQSSFPVAFAFTTATSESLGSLGFALNTSSNFTADILLYEFAGSALSGQFNHNTETASQSWSVSATSQGSSAAWYSFDLSSTPTQVDANKTYVLVFKLYLGWTPLHFASGASAVGDAGWSTFGSTAGSYTYNGGGNQWFASSIGWNLTFGASTPAVPGPGIAMAAGLGLAGMRRRRR